MQYNALRYKATQCNAVQYNIINNTIPTIQYNVYLTHPGHDDSLHVSEDIVPVLAHLWRLVWYQLPHVARLNIGEHPPTADILQVVSDIVNHLLPW